MIYGGVNMEMDVKKEKFDILDCHSSRDASYSAIVKLLTKQKVVRSRHITNPAKNTFAHRLIWKYGNDAIITTAELVNQRILEKNLAPAEKLYVQEAGVDENRFNPETRLKAPQLREELNIPASHKIVSNIGMIRPDKGQLDFIKAANLVVKQFPNTTFLQIGEATGATQSYKEKIFLERDNSSHRDNIKIIGYRENIEDYIGLSDIVVIASTGTEARTRLVPQCFLCKTNIICTRAGGLPEMIDHNHTGLLCKTENPGDIARNIEKLLTDPSLANKLKNNAYAYALEHLTMDKMMQGVLSVYEKAAQHPCSYDQLP